MDLTAAQGYSAGPVIEPVGSVKPVVENNPLQTRDPVSVEPVEETVPPVKDVPVVSELDDAASSMVDGAAQELSNAAQAQPASAS